jgi:hypothetical protein
MSRAREIMFRDGLDPSMEPSGKPFCAFAILASRRKPVFCHPWQTPLVACDEPLFCTPRHMT